MSKEDFISCIRRQEHSGIPTFLLDSSLGTVYAGIDVSEMYQYGFDAELSAKSISASRRALGHDAVVGSMMFADYGALGEECEYCSDKVPVIIKPAFEDPLDTEYCSPYDLIDTDTMNECIRSYGLVREYEPDAAIAAVVPSVFDVSARIRGKEAFLMDMNCDRYAFDEIVGFAKGIVNLVSDRIIDESGPDFVVVTSTFDDINLIGEDMFRDRSILDLTNIYYKCRGSNIPTIIHPRGVLTDGAGKKALKPLQYVGFEGLYYGGGNDHRTMAEMCQNQILLVGGLDIESIRDGTDDSIVKETNDVLDIMTGKDFIYSCSDSVDRGLDTHRMELMMSIVKGH